MTTPPVKRTIAIVTACVNANGQPEFQLTEVITTQENIAAGIHYHLAEAELLEAGYEEPFLHFDEGEAPAFLHPAVRQHLGLPPERGQYTSSAPEEGCPCPE